MTLFSLSFSLKQLGYGCIAHGLHHTRMMFLGRALAHRYSFQEYPGISFPRLRRDLRSKYGILCYHRVGVAGVPFYSQLHPQKFEAQMRYLKRHYRIVSMAQLCEELREPRDVPPTLAITFDDGYRDVYNYAFPVLQKYSIPATVYLIGRCMETGEIPWYDRIFLALVTSGHSTLEIELEKPRRFTLGSRSERMAVAWEIICFLRSIPEGQRRSRCAEMERKFPVRESDLQGRMLNWSQVWEMQRASVEFGAHTMTHPVVSRLDPTDFPGELTESKRLLENGLGANIKDFAYPFGKPEDLSKTAESFLRECGYRSAVTTIEGFNSTGSNPFALRRFQVGDDSSLANFSFSLCSKFLADQRDGAVGLSWSRYPDAAQRNA